jgi:hypothetical protein
MSHSDGGWTHRRRAAVSSAPSQPAWVAILLSTLPELWLHSSRGSHMTAPAVRRADFLMALAYPTDLATGHSRDFALRSCVLAIRFAEVAHLDAGSTTRSHEHVYRPGDQRCLPDRQESRGNRPERARAAGRAGRDGAGDLTQKTQRGLMVRDARFAGSSP